MCPSSNKKVKKTGKYTHVPPSNSLREDMPMSLVTTMGKYCFIQCDGPHCSKKIEHVDPEQAQQLVRLCGWVRFGEQWNCPDCTAKRPAKMSPGKRSRRSAAREKGENTAQ